jgi:ABC-2 type transport system permease protein
VGRAAGAIAGELDRGTMELLLAQPLARSRLILAHLVVDLIVIPILCLSLWAGTCLGYLLVGPIEVVDPPDLKPPPALLTLELGPFKATLKTAVPVVRETPEQRQSRLSIDLASIGPGLLVPGGLLFAMSGYTLWQSSLGRFRWRVLGLSVLVTLLMYLVNVLGQMWDLLAPLRPLTLFYYYQPQQVILGGGWTMPVLGLPVPMLLVLYGVGLAGYALAWRTFVRRDLPAPL